MKRYSVSLIDKGMQIKTTMRYHMLEWPLSKRQITRVGEDVDKREPLCTISVNVNWCSYCGTV